VLEQLPGSVRTELSTLLPVLADSAGGRGDSRDESAQARLFEAVLWLLDTLGEHSPVLLAIEDVHWADRATRAFVAFLGRSLCRERVLVVATYRVDELHRRHPLHPLLVELERDAGSLKVELPPLTREELAEQLEDLLGVAPERDLVERVLERSEGYPLFVEEIMAASLDGRGPLPSTLREALMVRVDRLPDVAREVLSVIAVGQRLDDRVLTHVTGLGQSALQEALREAVASHILVVAPDGDYRFRHALLREVVEDDLLPGERTAIHLRLARALETRIEDGGPNVYLTAGIAYHCAAAGDQPAALRWSVRAADAAERVHAYGEAASLLERVIELFDRVPDAESRAGADRVTILGRAAQDHGLEGNGARQEALARAALALVDERAQPRRAARLFEQLYDAQWHLGRGDESLASIEHALSLLPDDEISPERGNLLRAQAKTMMLRGRYREALAVDRETMSVADALGDLRLRGRALNTLGTCLIDLGEVDRGIATLREAIALSRQEDDAWQENVAWVNLADSLHLAGRLHDARSVVQDGLGRKLSPRRVWLVILDAELAIEAGEWDRAQAILDSIGGRLTGNTLVNFDLRRAELALGRGDHAVARERLDEAVELGACMDEPQFTGVLGALAAELERREGNLDAARRVLREALTRIEKRTDDTARLARLSATGSTVEADAAQRARDLGDPDDEHFALAQADEHLARAEVAAAGNRRLEVAWLLRARAERGRAGGAPDPRAYADAAAAWDALGRPYQAALMRLREGEAHALAGDRALAAAPATDARGAAERIGAQWLLSEVDGLAARARLTLGTAHAQEEPAPKQEAADDPFGLTPRERQVLELIARGATNREIGAQLFMAEKTASVHVSRILAKLDVHSRTEAAGVAHRLGLVG
jgi:ATP/maltotriose-dependent transcriptional regulator MalT